MLDRAENLLHDHYGGRDYWNVSIFQPASLAFPLGSDNNSVTETGFSFALGFFSSNLCLMFQQCMLKMVFRLLWINVMQ